LRIASIGVSAASFSRIISTVMRVPRITGFPSITRGSTSMRASKFFFIDLR